jgi:uncharacterized OsmC-like protein
MRFGARVDNSKGHHEAIVRSGDRRSTITIAPKPSGLGSSASGAELLFLALATCYCNDIYREAAKRGIPVDRVEVEVDGEFVAEGAPASDVKYRARVTSRANPRDLEELMLATDKVAEIQNTLRVQTPVELESTESNPAA